MRSPIFLQASHPDFYLIEGSVVPADPEVGLPERVLGVTAYSKFPKYDPVDLSNEQFLECEQLLIDEFHASD
jgi:hypothetical protein